MNRGFYWTIIICFAVIFLCMCMSLAMTAKAYDGEPIRTNRQEALHEAAELLRSYGFTDDSEPIRALSAAWWEEDEALNIIAKTISYEADPAYCEWEHSVAVGVVVLNRVKSEYFPNTVKDVVAAPGQYLPAYTWGFDNVPRRCYEAAAAAMNGEHDIPEDCFWQAQFPQGREVWKKFKVDTGYFASTTYICRGGCVTDSSKENPCFKCEDRRVGCHIDCERRAEWLDDHLKRKREENAIKAADGLISNYVALERDKSKRKRGSKRRLRKDK